jgi:serine/threonine-protein kinase HipA
MDTNGDWRLAPAYDLTYSPGPGGEHYMDIAGEGRRPTRAHVAELGQQHGYNARQVATVIETVRLAVADWPSIARGSGVSAASTKAIGDAHARVWADFEPK